MQQDRRPMMPTTGQYTSREAGIDRRIGRVRVLPEWQAGAPAQGEARKRLRLRMKRGERSRASVAPESVTRAVHRAQPTRRRRAVRGAALLDVMFTLTVLMAGAQGFAHWQTAGGMSSQALVTSPKVVAMAMPPAGVEGGACVGRGYWRAGDAMPDGDRFAVSYMASDGSLDIGRHP